MFTPIDQFVKPRTFTLYELKVLNKDPSGTLWEQIVTAEHTHNGWREVGTMDIIESHITGFRKVREVFTSGPDKIYRY